MIRLVVVGFAGLLATCNMVRAQGAQEAPAPTPVGTRLVDVVPTAQRQPAVWRYTFQAPAPEWNRPGFDDSKWAQGPAGFGTAGTPGAVVRTTWNTADVWLRREISLPATPPAGVDLAKLKLMVYHDEDVEIYLDGVRAASQGGFVSAYEAIDIEPAARAALKPGAKVVVAVHCHQTTGGQGVDVGLAWVPTGWRAPGQPDPATRAKQRYRDFAASRHGDANRGRELFASEQRVACVRCHAVDGKGGKVGPELFAVGDKFSRRELIDAVITPSANIAVGYSTTIVTTKDGDVIDGIVKDATDDAITLVGIDGQPKRIATAEIAERRTSNVSMMPEGLEQGLTQQEFADLVEYLVSLKLPESAAVARQGMPATIQEAAKPVGLVPFFEDRNRFEHPDWFGQVPGMANTYLVSEHETGKVWRVEKSADGEKKTLFGDFASEIRRGGATGLLGLAFHPRFSQNHKYYIQHERQENGRIFAYVSEKVASDDFKTDSGKPSRTIMRIACATDVHAGGGIDFGPDGFLYIAMGDTGPQGDPQGHGQDLKRPLGKMLRIDVDHEENGNAYAIPADNPFRGRADALPEIWAYGFREPWRFSFDSHNGDLWVGDVGQDTYEEVDLVHRGENYGWNVYEGFEPFSGRYRSADGRYVPPVFAYNRRYGNSITGGYVYRGDAKAPFYGVYVCADYTSKRVWGIVQENRVAKAIRQIATAPEHVASFGRDEAGNLYVVGYEGMVYRIDFSAGVMGD